MSHFHGILFHILKMSFLSMVVGTAKQTTNTLYLFKHLKVKSQLIIKIKNLIHFSIVYMVCGCEQSGIRHILLDDKVVNAICGYK